MKKGQRERSRIEQKKQYLANSWKLEKIKKYVEK
jgi:hypothetical protein